MALPESIGVPVGTVTPQDLKGHRRHFLFGQNVGTNSPRMLHDLQDAARRGVPIVCPTQDRILLRIALVDRRADAFWEWRRQLAGPSGCGLCGLESLAAAVPPPRRVTGDIRVSGDAIHRAMTILPERQRMNRLTGALHAAAFWTPTHGIVAVREDVGRHNALDQLTGAVIATALPAAARRRAADQPRLGRDGAKGGVLGRPDPGRGLGADRPCLAGRRRGPHHIDRRGAA